MKDVYHKFVKVLILLLFITSSVQSKPNCSQKTLNKKTIEWTNSAWSISKEVFDYIMEVVPKGATILELGSGWASEQLSKFYTVYSIEHNKIWLNKYNTNYIYAPIVNSWYDTQILERELPAEYHLILVDGPNGRIGRYGFYENLYLFNTDATIIFDDVHRSAEYRLMVDVSKKLDRPFYIYEDKFRKKFGVIEVVNN